MALPHIAPARFFVNSLKQFLVRQKAFEVRDESEFIRPVTKYVDQKAAQIINLEPMFAFGQNGTPLYLRPSSIFASSFLSPPIRG
jgi:hypothetical protein